MASEADVRAEGRPAAPQAAVGSDSGLAGEGTACAFRCAVTLK